MSRPDDSSSRPRGRADLPLTAREQELLALIAAGKRTRDISQQLNISQNTVKSHLTNAYRKIGARNRVEAARHYLQGAPSAGAPRSLIDRQIDQLEARLEEISSTVAEADRLRQALGALRTIQQQADRP